MFYFVIFIQTAINTGVGVGAILLAGECIEVRFCISDSHVYTILYLLLHIILIMIKEI